MGVFGDRQLSGRGRTQDVTMPGWHGKPTLGIKTERRSPLEHEKTPFALQQLWNRNLMALFTTKLHFFALYQQTHKLQESLREFFPMKSRT